MIDHLFIVRQKIPTIYCMYIDCSYLFWTPTFFLFILEHGDTRHAPKVANLYFWYQKMADAQCSET